MSARIGIGLLATLAALVVASPQTLGAQQADRAALVAALDSAARAYAENDMVPGVAVAVVQNGVTLLEQGYGYVDLEWMVPTPANASYEIGSITKQFTAAALMLLVEEGEVDLDADFTEYVDFDTQGHMVPVRRLLDHSSGIKGYTEMPVFGEFMPLKLPPDSLLRVVEKTPFQFAPGHGQVYNNSAYFILGRIIEKVSGQSYGDFVTERLFEPADMDDSYYCSEAEMRKNRAHGYDAAGQGKLIRARYLDHTWPYSAGSLCSTAGDLARWNMALHGGQVLSDESYEAMITPMPLEGGWGNTYAMGLNVGTRGDSKSIEHGGGINGFVSAGTYFPGQELIVIALQNSTGAPIGQLAATLTEIVLGPVPEPEPSTATYAGDLEELVGEYTGFARGPDRTINVRVEDGALTFEVLRGPTWTPAYDEGLTWRQGGLRLTFTRGDDGQIDALRQYGGAAHYVLKRVGGD